MKLTPKQETFAQHYAIHGSPREAWMAAGYAWKQSKNATVDRNAQKLLNNTKVIARIEELQQRRRDRAEHIFDVTSDAIIQELAAIGFASMQNYVRIDMEGQPTVDLSDLKPHQWAAIGEITIEDIETGQRTGKRTKFKLLDKKGALVELGKQLGLFQEKHKHDHSHKHELIESAAAEFDAGLDQFFARVSAHDSSNAAPEGDRTIN